MASERALARWVTSKLKEGKAFYQRFEDKFTPGIPDLMFLDKSGQVHWVELKCIPCLPVRPTTVVNVGMRMGQVEWLGSLDDAGGKGYTLVQVDADVFLFKGACTGIQKMDFAWKAHIQGRAGVVKWLQS